MNRTESCRHKQEDISKSISHQYWLLIGSALTQGSMQPELTGTLWFSEKRIKLLSLLAEGIQDIERIKRSLNVSSREIMPHIRKLKKDQIVLEEKQGFTLTPIGELLVDNMKIFLDTARVIDEHCDFWNTRDFRGIPDILSERIGELGHYYLIEPGLHNIYDFPREFKDNVLRCKEIKMLKSYMHPTYPSLCLDIIEKADELSLFVVPSLLERIKNDFEELADKLNSSSNTNIFIVNEHVNIPILCVTEKFLYFSIFNNEGRYEHRDILSFDRSAVLWGEELIEQYRLRSTIIRRSNKKMQN